MHPLAWTQEKTQRVTSDDYDMHTPDRTDTRTRTRAGEHASSPGHVKSSDVTGTQRIFKYRPDPKHSPTDVTSSGNPQTDQVGKR